MLCRASLSLVCVFSALVVAGCDYGETEVQAAEERQTASVGEKKGSTEVQGKQFHAQLLEIAANYERFGRFDESLRFGPSLCAAPSGDASQEPKAEPSRVRLSKSRNSETHGKKLYYLFAKDQMSYGYDAKRQPVGQTIVKEAWKPETTKDVRGAAVAFDPSDKRHYRAGEKLGLFIMTKLDPETPGTDEGWVYGTVSADGRTVTSAGRVENCMACHRSGKTTDRMFGVRESEPGDENR